MSETALVEISEEEKRAIALLDRARAITILNNDDRIAVEDMMRGAKMLKDAIWEERDPICKDTYALWKKQVARRDSAIQPVEDAMRIAKQKCIAYDAEQERIRLEEQRRLEAEARKRAEEEALAIAAQAEAEGDKETAEAIISAPLDVAPIIAPKTAPAPSRLTAGRSVWSAEVVNLMMLVKAVAHESICNDLIDRASQIKNVDTQVEILKFLKDWNSTAKRQPIALLQVNQTALNSAAKLIKINGSTAIHGCRVVEKKV